MGIRTCFFYFPINNTGRFNVIPKPLPGVAAMSKKKVLIVDDEKSLSELIMESLMIFGD